MTLEDLDNEIDIQLEDNVIYRNGGNVDLTDVKKQIKYLDETKVNKSDIHDYDDTAIKQDIEVLRQNKVEVNHFNSEIDEIKTSLSNKVNKEEITNLSEFITSEHNDIRKDINALGNEKADSSNVYSKAETNTLLDKKANTSDIPSAYDDSNIKKSIKEVKDKVGGLNIPIKTSQLTNDSNYVDSTTMTKIVQKFGQDALVEVESMLSNYVTYEDADDMAVNIQYQLNGKAEKEDIPKTLPNPHSLTINGQSYDGSSEVEISVEGGSGDNTDYNLLVNYTVQDGQESSTKFIFTEDKYPGISNCKMLIVKVFTPTKDSPNRWWKLKAGTKVAINGASLGVYGGHGVGTVSHGLWLSQTVINSNTAGKSYMAPCLIIGHSENEDIVSEKYEDYDTLELMSYSNFTAVGTNIKIWGAK